MSVCGRVEGMPISGRFTYRTLALIAAVMLAAVLAEAGVLAAGPVRAERRSAPATQYVKATPACSAANRAAIRCFAMALEHVARGTPGARALRVRPTSAYIGPAGGYTPAAFAKAYGINTGRSTNLTVGIVDAFSNPNVRADLAAFDAHYRLPVETGSSFKVLNQDGHASPLPPPNSGWGLEIDLDVQAVRA